MWPLTARESEYWGNHHADVSGLGIGEPQVDLSAPEVSDGYRDLEQPPHPSVTDGYGRFQTVADSYGGSVTG